jgi:Zn-dependent M28 family amino/carboxypeptidase
MERPEEIVLIGGHLDSWDLGTGATDDGAGIAIIFGAARLIACRIAR